MGGAEVVEYLNQREGKLSVQPGFGIRQQMGVGASSWLTYRSSFQPSFGGVI